mgnify:CR=1 FL=1
MKLQRSITQRIVSTILSILLSSFIGIGYSTCLAQDSGDLTLHKDSVWHDSITGRRMHLQRLGGLDTLVYIKPRPLTALAKDLGLNATILAWDHYVQDRKWAEVTAHVIKQHFTHGPRLDNDSFSGNQFSHPYHGGMFYNTARNEGLSYGVSLLYPVIGSASWEWLCETNPPSINDLLSTGVGGAAIGEVTNRVSDIFFDDSRRGLNRVVREIIGSALNPVRAVHRLISGEMWRVSHARGKHLQPQPYSFELGVGTRFMGEANGAREHLSSSYIDFAFNYGDRFTTTGHSKPFDLFSLSLLANLSSKHPTVGQFDISGRLASRQIHQPGHWSLDVGFYQNLKYVEHYSSAGKEAHNFSIMSEAVSFGGGLYAERRATQTHFFNDCMLSAVVFGGTNSDYYSLRRYNYASGLSLRNTTQFSINRRAIFIGKLYCARLYSFLGYTTAEIQQQLADGIDPSCWGDQGNHSVITTELNSQLNIIKNMRLGIGYQYFLRRSNYKYFPSVTAKSYEWKLGIIYSI